MANNSDRQGLEPRIIRTLGSQTLSGSTVPNRTLSSEANPHFSENIKEATVNTTSPTPLSTPIYRIAQACDRCRSKKTRCDGKRPQCSQCAAVGFECRISDKLLRKAYPKGYTESLEERVRELEAENKRLLALCDIKEQQISLVSQSRPSTSLDSNVDGNCKKELKDAPLNLSSTNIYLLNQTVNKQLQSGKMDNDNSDAAIDSLAASPSPPPKDHVCDGVSCTNRLHVKPTSTSLSDPTAISFEQNEAPGLPAVKALKSMTTHQRSTQLATLVSLSIPRSTEEILFIPQLLTRIRQIFGFNSKQCLYTVSLLSSLKNRLPAPSILLPSTSTNSKEKNEDKTPNDDSAFLKTFQSTSLSEFVDLKKFLISLKFDIDSFSKQPEKQANGHDSDLLSLTEIKELLHLFFKFWSNQVPILNNDHFLLYFNNFVEIIKDFSLISTKANSTTKNNVTTNHEIFTLKLLMMLQMGLLIKIKKDKIKDTVPRNSNAKYIRLMSYYHQISLIIPKNPYFLNMSTTSLPSLQLLSLASFYYLNVGDISAIYGIRGRIVSMAQQLRLHRCPSAVLSVHSNPVLQKFEQSERRLLFWAIYYVDVFASLQLGVPRLLKDFDIECALPISDVEYKDQLSMENEKMKNKAKKIQLQGQVSSFSLQIIRFAKILGNILDSIFKRGMMDERISSEVALVHENALDNWRNQLPEMYYFKITVNGTVNLDEIRANNSRDIETPFETKDIILFEKKILLLFYFLAKSMIHLPVIATKPLSKNVDNVMKKKQSMFNNDSKGTNNHDHMAVDVDMTSPAIRTSSSYIILQQATNATLTIFQSINWMYLPLPLNVSRTLVRFSLLCARGSLEYTKGGALFLDNKNLLLDTIKDIENDRLLELPGIASWHTLKLFDMTINLLLKAPNVKVERLDKFLEKKLNYYNRLMGLPLATTTSLKPLFGFQSKNSPETKPRKSTVKRETPDNDYLYGNDTNNNNNPETDQPRTANVGNTNKRLKYAKDTRQSVDKDGIAKAQDASNFHHDNKKTMSASNLFPFSFSNTDLTALFAHPEEPNCADSNSNNLNDCNKSSTDAADANIGNLSFLNMAPFLQADNVTTNQNAVCDKTIHKDAIFSLPSNLDLMKNNMDSKPEKKNSIIKQNPKSSSNSQLQHRDKDVNIESNNPPFNSKSNYSLTKLMRLLNSDNSFSSISINNFLYQNDQNSAAQDTGTNNRAGSNTGSNFKPASSASNESQSSITGNAKHGMDNCDFNDFGNFNNFMTNVNYSGVDYDYIVDASLGLAPLLVDTPDISNTNTTSTTSNRSKNSIILDSTFNDDLDRSHTNAREVLNHADSILSQGIMSSISTRTADIQRSSSSGNDSKSNGYSQKNPKNANNGQLDAPSTLFQMRRTSSGPSTSHRGPRRPQKHRYSTDQSKGFSGGSSNADNLPDLFQWQNAK
ncbi:DNA-binding transcription factor CAT8 SKDI_13G4110 [Saccharomyces kudriavzevii IFO 1802]|uniref:Uncharacterized protein n=2 Tax=Saccharomyces kudriavzevii (strain ATCC MYA-4449 / AS 2.2408 / CBS 8840 / NBRC 1802 / NCYC 2889) TaxID=226230 RepID=A0AA35NLU2_SACK1|nr:uncharacterized protein SKDI_13G4110 [Saccharomyces kudriavzevii IFO 1802]EJT42916.1 CAT8-like protein [Saccharomyces kudriavzevii IFO 1802]CAI4048889.1 hypothetical protein SKDI_13G4110 [Saccharomyces kudriavzevii IFO 1802]